MAQNLDLLQTSFEQKPQWLAFAAHLLLRTVKELRNCSKNENTAKRTGFRLSVSKDWCIDKEITDEIEKYEPAELTASLKLCWSILRRRQ